MTKYAGRAPYPFTPGDNMTGQCSSCGEVFYGEVAFDRHRQDDGAERVCLDPARITVKPGGKVWWIDDRRRWHYSRPMTDAERARIADRVGAEPRRTALPGIPGTPRAEAPSESGNATKEGSTL